MLVALAALVASIVLDHDKLVPLVKLAPLILVLVGTVAATAAGATRRDLRVLPRALLVAMRPAVRYDAARFTAHLIEVAHSARTSGIAVLERGLPEAKRDPFVRTGVELVMTTSDPERVRMVLDAEIDGIRRRHQVGYRAFRDMAGYAPTLGILGTVIGLVQVLHSLVNPAHLGPAIAGAFTATLWGVLSANLVWLPIANKLRRLTDDEIAYKELVTEGLLAVQEGVSGPRLRDRLVPFLSPGQRPGEPKARERQAA
jgi:chemotaxis protein MotA